MEKEVFITIKGVHTAEGEADETEIIIPGTYYFRDGKHFVCYEEANEHTGEVSKSLLKISPSSVEMIKRGSNATHLVFEKDKKYYTNMKTEIGALSLAMDTKAVQIQGTQEDRTIEATISYSLEMNEQKVSDCQVKIVVSSDSQL
jgi:uncharacterized beta-barrel protein YwiB (DUF1934 family)